MLRHFEHQPVAVVVGFERVQDFRQRAGELHIDARAHHLGDVADLVAGGLGRSIHVVTFLVDQSASAPEMISISSFVIIAWRVRLYCNVSRSITSPAFRVAESIAVMRAPCSEAAFSRSARKICTDTLRGSSSARISASSGSYS